MRSILTLETPAESYDLTVLDMVKLELGISNTSQDEKLAGWIHQASDQLASACARVFAEETVSEVFRLGNESRFVGEGPYHYFHQGGSVRSLVLQRRPVSTVISVTVDGIVLDSTEYEFKGGSGVLWKKDSANDILISWTGNKITVKYTAGYELLQDLPYDVERACILLVKSYKSLSERNDLSLKSLEVPGVIAKSWETRGNAAFMSLPPEVQVLISPYVETIIR